MSLSALLALVVSMAACERVSVPQVEDKPDLGLLTTLPIYWNETADPGEMLADQDEAPWPRAVLERQFNIVLLDTLAGETGIASVDALLLAQPRALSAQENVALDDWVQAGGRVLIFADPMLTAHSRFHIGDRRRPQDVILLSPILARWGLELTFEAGQEEGERLVDAGNFSIPVNLPGRFKLVDGQSRCAIEADGIIARCAIGEGYATLIADAALLDPHGGDSPSARGDILSDLAELPDGSSARDGD